MAYAFSAIDELLKGSQPGSDIQGSDIFASGSPQQVGAQTQGTAKDGDGIQSKTVDEGGGVSNAANPGAVSSGSDTATDSNLAADRIAVKENVGKTEKPSAIDSMRDQLAANTTRLQSEADAYLAGEKGKQQYSSDKNTVAAATNANRDQGAFDYISSLLGTGKAKQAGEFEASDVGVKDVDYLKTDAGLKQLITKGKDPRFSSGMAAFDLRALKKTPEFNQTIGGIQQGQKDLYSRAGALGDELATQVGEYGQGQLTEAQKAVRRYLGDSRDELTRVNEAEAMAYNRDLAGLDLAALGDPARQVAAQAVRGRLDQTTPYASNFVDPNAVAERDFIRRNRELGAQDFVSRDEAARYNNIMSLLGEGGQNWLESAALPENNYTVDNAALERALLADAQSKYGVYEDQTNQEIQRIRNEAQARGDAEDARLAALLETQGTADWQRQQGRAALEGSSFYDAMKDFITPDMYDAATGYQLTAPEMRDLGWEDMLRADEAENLNRLSGTIGAGQDYYAGSYTANDPNRFNSGLYLADMEERLRQARGVTPSQQSGIPNTGISLGGNVASGAPDISIPGLPGTNDAIRESKALGGAVGEVGQNIGNAAQDYLVSGLESAPGGKGATGSYAKARESAEAEAAQAAARRAANERRSTQPRGNRGGFGFGSRLGDSIGGAVGLSKDAIKQLEADALRKRLYEANDSIVSNTKAAGGSVANAVKGAVGDVVSGAKNVGGDIAKTAKRINPFKKFRRF